MSYRREYSKRHPDNRDEYWCQNCQAWVKLAEMKSLTKDDDWSIDKLCPGCDLVLLEIVNDPDEDA